MLLLRRTVLIADTFAHALLPGIAIAFLVFGSGFAGMYVGAAVAGLGTAAMSLLITRTTRLSEDAAFGTMFAICFAFGVAVMSMVTAPVDLLHYLFGNILAVTETDLWRTCVTTCATVAALSLGYRLLLMEAFDAGFLRAGGIRTAFIHLAVLATVVFNLVGALQAVGMVLSLGLFILPAASAYQWCERFGTMLIAAAGIGSVGAAVGFLFSWYFNLPSGACMVLALGVIFLASLVTSPRHSIFASS